jgi:MerR HTH family regulatory protein
MTKELTVSVLAGQVGLRPDAVRYYERLGLLPLPARSRAGYRLYDQATVDRLRLIKGAQRVGLRLRHADSSPRSPAPTATRCTCWPASPRSSDPGPRTTRDPPAGRRNGAGRAGDAPA